MNRTPRRFVVSHLPWPGSVRLSESDAHHIQHVLRLRVGDPCILSDSEGREAKAHIASFVDGGGVDLILSEEPRGRIREKEIIVAQAWPQRGIMDRIVEKAGELGIGELIPMRTARTQVHAKGDGLTRAMARWRRIARAAQKQSGNPETKIAAPVSFAAVLRQGNAIGQWFVSHPEACLLSYDVLRKAIDRTASDQPVLLAVGPEGGFTKQEIARAIDARATVFSIPGGILRTDTAFVSLVSIFRYGMAA